MVNYPLILEYAELSDNELVHRSRQADLDAFNTLVSRHESPIYSLCLHCLRTRRQAEDAAIEIFLQAYRELIHFNNTDNFGTWLRRRAGYHCLYQVISHPAIAHTRLHTLLRRKEAQVLD